LVEQAHDFTLVAIALGSGLAGILLAYFLYIAKPELPARIVASLGGLHRLVFNKFYVDELYDLLFVHPLIRSSRSFFWPVVDTLIIDGAVNGVAAQARNVGRVLRSWQSGSIRTYASWVVVGSVVILLIVTMAGGVR